MPNKAVKCNNEDPPWITKELKSAIKHKNRVYGKFVQRGRRPKEWNLVKTFRNRTSKMHLDNRT